MLKNWAFFVLTVFFSSTYDVSSNILPKNDSSIMEASAVHLRDGIYDSVMFSCSSSLVSGEPESYTPDYKWTYYTHSSSNSVQLFDGIKNTYNETFFNTSLTIYSFNPGHYKCDYVFYDKEFIHTFQITGYANIPGVDLHDNCVTSNQCYALNSTCTTNGTSTCECVAPHDINFSGSDSTPACLKHQSEGSHCNIDAQCDGKCKDTVCSPNNGPTTGPTTYGPTDDDLSSGAIARNGVGSLPGVALIGFIIYCVFIK